MKVIDDGIDKRRHHVCDCGHEENYLFDYNDINPIFSCVNCDKEFIVIHHTHGYEVIKAYYEGNSYCYG